MSSSPKTKRDAEEKAIDSINDILKLFKKDNNQTNPKTVPLQEKKEEEKEERKEKAIDIINDILELFKKDNNQTNLKTVPFQEKKEENVNNGPDNKPHGKIDYLVYPTFFILIVIPIFVETYSTYYKLTKTNEAISDFKGPHMPDAMIYSLLCVALIFAVYMLIIDNAKNLKNNWTQGKSTKNLFELFITSLSEGVRGKKNSTHSPNGTEIFLRHLATLLVIGNTVFYVLSTAKGSYKSLITDWGFNHSVSTILAVFCSIGAFIAGTFFALKKTQETLPYLWEVVFGRDKFKKKAAFVLIIFVNALAVPYTYELAHYSLHYVSLSIINTILLTTITLSVSLHSLYRSEIENLNKNRPEENTEEKSSHREEIKKRRGWFKIFLKVLCFSTCALISLVNLLATALSGGHGCKEVIENWKWFCNKMPQKTLNIVLVFSFCVATVALAVGRYYFSHLREKTLEMEKDVSKMATFAKNKLGCA